MISAEQGPKTRPDGGSTSFNALAFSTLLSSQETDAHRQVSFRFPVGATLKLYPRDSFVSTSFPEAFRKVADSPILQPPASGLQRLRARTVAPKAKLLGGSPGPGPHRVLLNTVAFRPPRGKMNSTGTANPRQIGGSTHLPHHHNPHDSPGPAGRHSYVGTAGATVVWEVLRRGTARR